MRNIIFRTAQLDDVEKISDLQQLNTQTDIFPRIKTEWQPIAEKFFRSDISKLREEWRQSILSNQFGIFVCEVDCEIVGILKVGPADLWRLNQIKEKGLIPFCSPEEIGQLHTIHVKNNFRDIGIGSALLFYASEWIIKKHYKFLFLYSPVDEQAFSQGRISPAVSFYEGMFATETKEKMAGFFPFKNAEHEYHVRTHILYWDKDTLPKLNIKSSFFVSLLSIREMLQLIVKKFSIKRVFYELFDAIRSFSRSDNNEAAILAIFLSKKTVQITDSQQSEILKISEIVYQTIRNFIFANKVILDSIFGNSHNFFTTRQEKNVSNEYDLAGEKPKASS